MAKPGRRPKPTALKLLHGTLRKSRVNKREPRVESEIPSPPEFLHGPARAEWVRAAKLLHECGLLCGLDRAALAAYCQIWGQWCEVIKQLDEQGFIVSDDGRTIINPLARTSMQLSDQLRKFITEFGMSPSSRTRVSGSGGKEEQGGGEFEKFLNEK